LSTFAIVDPTRPIHRKLKNLDPTQPNPTQSMDIPRRDGQADLASAAAWLGQTTIGPVHYGLNLRN